MKFFKKPQVFWAIGIFFLYTAINIIISQFYVTAKYIPYYYRTFNWPLFVVGAIFSIAIGILVSVNIVEFYVRHKEQEKIKKSGALTCVGTVVGLAGGVCAACAGGIVPFTFGFLGIAFSFASLPLKGIEVQALALALLIISLVYLKK